MITIILDSACTYLSGANQRSSILGAPLGTGTVLDHLVGLSTNVGGGTVRVLTPIDADGTYLESLAATSAGLATPCSHQELPAILSKLEPSDWVLILHPRCWPVRGLNLSEFTREQSRHFGAWFAVPLGTARDGAEERVHCDETGRVQSIRRYYDHVTRLDLYGGSLPCALVRACALKPEDLKSMDTLRLAIAARGVPSRDVPIKTDVVDLTEPRGLLAVNERMLTAGAAAGIPPGYSQVDRAVICGRGALIHHTAQIIPPVVIQSGALIEDNVTIIGPTVIGERVTIQRDSLVAQSVIPADTVVPANARVRHCAGATLRSAGEVSHEHGSGEAFEPQLQEMEGSEVEDGSVLASGESTHERRGYVAVKRVFDTVAAAIGLVVLSPVLLLIAAAIKLDSRGPVFFKHRRERSGGGGREFKCFKFRTMRADAHNLQRQLVQQSHVDGPHFKIANDPRVTRLGQFLRSTNLDELPQLINVLRGDMSLIGPRPSPFRENQVCIPWRRARLSVRPGITGLWQVCRRDRGEGDFQEWIYYDIQYVRNLSPWLDFKILLATVLTLGGKFDVPVHWLMPRRGFRERGRGGFGAVARQSGTRMDTISLGR